MTIGTILLIAVAAGLWLLARQLDKRLARKGRAISTDWSSIVFALIAAVTPPSLVFFQVVEPTHTNKWISGALFVFFCMRPDRLLARNRNSS